MRKGTKIEWTDETWNPIAGCSVVSPGCTNCYAMRRVAPRLSGNPATPHYAGTVQPSKGGPVWTGKIGVASDAVMTKPLRWTRPRMIFVNSTSDLFHEGVADETIDRVFAVMALCPQHIFQILTKRPERMRKYLLESRAPTRWWNAADLIACDLRLTEGHTSARYLWAGSELAMSPLPNVWLGVSCEDQTRADERIPVLIDTPAAVRWVSAEPLLGPINFSSVLGGTLWIGGQRGCAGSSERNGAMHHGIGTKDCPRHLHHHHDERCKPALDWIVAGGESGNGARPMHPDWARDIRDQCARAEVPFLFKQWGEFMPKGQVNAFGRPWHGRHEDGRQAFVRYGKKTAGRFLDGILHDAYPAAPR